MMRPKGNFLMRFSDSGVGGITIAWVADDAVKPGWLMLFFFLTERKVFDTQDLL